MERNTLKKEIPVTKGQSIEINIERLGTGGEGVGRVDGFTVFVQGALPGEKVEAVIETVKKNYAAGKLLRIIEESKDRTVPQCPIYKECGGCQLQHLSYEAQLKMKKQQVIDALVHIGGQKDVPVHETLGSAPWNYRNKMQFPVGLEKGKAVIGCFAQGSHDIINTENCLIQKEENNIIAAVMREAVEKYHIPVYNEDKHTGVLRHVMGRVGKDGSVMVVLVTAKEELHHAKEIVKLLRARIPKLVSVQQNIQTYHNNVILGRKTNILWGKPTILDSIGALTFHISARSFFQVNTEQAEVLYNKALEYAALTGKETVIDAYCGTGTISLFLAQRARRVYGIEIVAPAIRDAEKNARDNHIRNAEFIVGDATAVMPRLYKEGIRPDVIVVDPPRAGCTPVVLETIARMNPTRIVYVSCNPASLARDLKILEDLGYKAKEAQPVDMFPQTSHVETVARIEKISGK
ncbi:MAG: 23S rRNA (uracil(1939)-C(5))-methyltransferase RlmD [Schwartzia sp.]|nr:23S rRNA (uracil(1939)-C(5))-methyltransferase RlmD [Schwartzia sp. (in: firmicutes)]